MVAVLFSISVAFLEGDWLLLTPGSGDPKPFLKLMVDDPIPHKAEEVSKKFNLEFHKLSDGTTLFLPSTANERERRRLQIKLIDQLKTTQGKWTKIENLPSDLRNYVNAQLHSKSDDHTVSLISSINISIGGRKVNMTESIPPGDRSLPDKPPEFYDDKLAEAYSIGSCSLTFGSKQSKSVVDRAKTLELAAVYVQELFLEIDKGLRESIAKSLENNDAYSKKMRDLITMSGRKVKELPKELQNFLIGGCFGPEVKLSDISEDIYTIDSKGYALEAHANYGGEGAIILPIKTGG